MKKKQDQERRRRLRRQLAWILTVFGLGIILIQVPVWMESIHPAHRLVRVGTATTDRMTDHCLKNLWLLSRDMQLGKPANEKLVCPACGRPYIFGVVDGKPAAWCPCPEEHDLSGLVIMRESIVDHGVIGRNGWRPMADTVYLRRQVIVPSIRGFAFPERP